jgi:hypothetical protein
MTPRHFLNAFALGAIALIGCKKVPLTSKAPVPAGTMVFRFTRKVQGPLELTLNGSRVAVKQGNKGGNTLIVSGLQPGSYKYFLASARDAFGPDLGEVSLPDDQGVYLVTLSQRFNAVLYGKAAALPSAEGLAGASASLETR